MVPEGWRDATLGELVRLQRGHDLPSTDRIDGHVKVIGGGGPNGFHNVARAPAPGIVIGRSGSGIGNAFWADEPFWPLNTGLYVTDFLGNDPRFCFLWLDWIDFSSHNTGGAQPSLNRNNIYPIPLPLPPLPEQQKIAEILATWDKAIETTEALLANARTLKRALMQSLLTGTRRFPGFKDQPWRGVQLGDVLREVNKPVDWSDDDLYRLVSVRRRSGGVFHREDLYGHQILTKTLKHAHAGDFLISKMQVVHGAMALVTPEFDGMQISGSYISLVSKDKARLDIRFFDWLSRTQDMYRRAYQCSYGVHIEKMTFNFALFLKEQIPMPSSVAEQVMIADALDTAEAEERWFEAEVECLRTEKKSLMQQLLTGKRRVVANA